MKIAFVKPAMGLQGIRPYRSRAMMEPLVFATLAGLTPAGHDIAFFDERCEPVPVNEPFDLAAISVETYTARRAYQLAAAFRQHGTPVVLGGFHPTLCPEEAASHADAIALGEVEATWPRLLADAQAGQLHGIYRAPGRADLAQLTIDRTIFRGKPYLPMALLQYSRGCLHDCDFCAIRQFYGRRLSHRPVDDVLREVDGLKTRTLFFVDDNLVADRSAARDLCTALISRRVRWVSQASLDVTRDPDLLDLLAESGCFGLIIGLESLNPHNLAQMGKSWAGALGGYARALQALKARGLLVYGAFVFGYDHDTLQSFTDTVDFAIAEKLFIATFNMLQPYPGTPLYARLRDEGRLLYDRWWMHPEYLWDRAAFHPARMTPDELAAGCREARRRFNSAGSILTRSLDLQAHLKDLFRAFVYFSGNAISREDIRRKAGVALGYPDHAVPGQTVPSLPSRSVDS